MTVFNLEDGVGVWLDECLGITCIKGNENNVMFYEFSDK